MFFMYRTPITMAVMESPGMPKTSAGIHAPASALLLADPDSTMPSTCPVPNFSGSFENFLLMAYDIHAAMSAPAPGKAPTAVPRTLPRKICLGYFLANAHWPDSTLPTFSTTNSAGGLVSTTKRMISEMANMPIIMAIMPMPPVNSALPNVKRGKPAGLPRPTQATNKPSSKVTTPLRGWSVVMKTAQVRPSSTNQKYSKELKFNAKSANAGAAKISTTVPNKPPTAEKTNPAPKAISACPFLVMAKASSV